MQHTSPYARAVAEDAAREAGKYDAWRGRWLFGMRADAYASANANANADANAYADADAEIAKEETLRNGLFAVQLWSGNLMVLRVGWFQRLEGDDYRVSWSTPYRGEYATRLSTVWSEGPKAAPNWTWSPPLECDVTRLQVVPLARLDPAKWAEICPCPKWWVEE